MTPSRSIRYFVREAVADLWNRRTVNLISVGTIGASLYIVGVFILLTTNVGNLVASWAEENRISVFLSDGATEDARTRLGGWIGGDPAVKSFELVGKDEALARFRRDFPDLADLAVGLDANPLPASFEITIKTEAADPATVETLARALSARDGVEGVRYDLAWVRRVRTLLGVIGLGGAFLGAILVMAAVITISGVIRLNVLARREEIEILRLVGATRGFIRGPFLVEGAFQGIAASILALAAIMLTWLAAGSSRTVEGDLLLKAVVGGFLPLWAPPALLGAGLAVGLAGSLLSVRRVFASSGAAPF